MTRFRFADLVRVGCALAPRPSASKFCGVREQMMGHLVRSREAAEMLVRRKYSGWGAQRAWPGRASDAQGPEAPVQVLLEGSVGIQ